MKGCVNDVIECRYNCRKNVLKEIRWNRIKRTSSRMIRKDEENVLKSMQELDELLILLW